MTTISSQAEFDAVFDGSTISDAAYYIQSKGSAYTLSNIMALGSNVFIDGDPDVVIQRADVAAKITILGLVSAYVSNVYLGKNLTFDGQGGVDAGLGGSYEVASEGGGVRMTYAEDIYIGMHITNCLTGSIYSGGGLFDVNMSSRRVFVEHISYCQAGASASGGGVAFLGYSEDKSMSYIHNVHNCISGSSGGGINNVKGCVIDNIHDNTAGSGGGGIAAVEKCVVTNVFNNTAATKGGGVSAPTACRISDVYGNTVTGGYGGGVSDPHRSHINNISYNNATGNGGGIGVDPIFGTKGNTITNVYKNNCTGDGGGVYSANVDMIKNVMENTSDGNGAGCSDCTNCSIEHVSYNEATGNGGGAYNCTTCHFNGIWTENYGSTYNMMASCSGITFILNNTTATVNTTYTTGINV